VSPVLAQAMSVRKGELREMLPLGDAEGRQRLVFEAPSRGLIGFRSAFATLTRGTGILHRAFAAYGRYRGPIGGVRKGALISSAGAPVLARCCMPSLANRLYACNLAGSCMHVLASCFGRSHAWPCRLQAWQLSSLLPCCGRHAESGACTHACACVSMPAFEKEP
jgi:hypothetical protein